MIRRVYLDLCALKRPFDDRNQPRVWLETQAVSLIIQAVQDKRVELVVSSFLEYENSRNPWALRRDAVARWLGLAALIQGMTPVVEKRANELESLGMKTFDALHLACAEAADCHVFVTCDDKVRRRYSGKLRVFLPTECAMALQEESDGDSGSE